ncbi:hypothetical protein HDU90_001416, partial [Geranomyces variabilis]
RYARLDGFVQRLDDFGMPFDELGKEAEQPNEGPQVCYVARLPPLDDGGDLGRIGLQAVA